MDTSENASVQIPASERLSASYTLQHRQEGMVTSRTKEGFFIPYATVVISLPAIARRLIGPAQVRMPRTTVKTEKTIIHGVVLLPFLTSAANVRYSWGISRY